MEIDKKTFMLEQARFIRIRVDLPFDKPLRRGGLVVNPEGDKVCIGFKFEWLIGFCYQCGIIEHEVRDCATLRKSRQSVTPYGKRLKVGFRWPDVNSDKGRHIPPQRRSGIQVKLVPVSSNEGETAGNKTTQSNIAMSLTLMILRKLEFKIVLLR